MKKLIIEARINEYAMRDRNPNVPWTPQEIATDAAKCREAGAAIVHFHPRMSDGAPESSARVTQDIVRRIRDRSDILINPTLGSIRQDLPVSERIKLLLDEGSEARPDILPLCLGSLNWDCLDPETGRLCDKDRIYLNRTIDLATGARALMDAGIGVSCVLWEVGYTRRLAAFLDTGIIGEPAYAVFHLVSGGLLSGHPATRAGLDAHLAFLPRDQVEWAVMSLGGSLLPLAETIIGAGGHLQIGIGDYPYAETGAPTNSEVVRAVVEIANRLGHEIASPDEARTLLRLQSPKEVGNNLAGEAALYGGEQAR